MELKATIGMFFVEFSAVETQFVGLALRSLSKDSVFVEQAEKLLDLEARLTLLERMAFARGASTRLTSELKALLLRILKLHHLRVEIAGKCARLESKAAASPVLTKSKPMRPGKDKDARLGRLTDRLPGIAEIRTYVAEAKLLQDDLRELAKRLDYHVSSLPV